VFHFLEVEDCGFGAEGEALGQEGEVVDAEVEKERGAGRVGEGAEEVKGCEDGEVAAC
jgi:hypothetical protein